MAIFKRGVEVKKQVMSSIILIVICVALSGIISFISGVFYADKTSGIPKNGHFSLEGYFTEFRQTEFTLFDGEYSYFSNNTGASPDVSQDYKNNPNKYSAYEADIFITNTSNFRFVSVWAVLPGTRINISPTPTVEEIHVVQNRNIWLDAWLSEGFTIISPQEEFHSTIRLVVKTEGMLEVEINQLLFDLQINIQAGICEKSLNPEYDISRSIFVEFPVFFKN